MHVAEALQLTFQLARGAQGGLLTKWTKLSYKVGGSLGFPLIMSIQRHGQIDAVLRCIEESYSTEEGKEKHADAFQSYHTLAVFWVGGMYEIVRLLRERQISVSLEAQQLLKEFELLRMPLEKLELAKDRTLKGPLTLNEFNNDGTLGRPIEYDPKDSKRIHIMPGGLSARGSITWLAIDVQSNSQRWIERLYLSNKILELWATQ